MARQSTARVLSRDQKIIAAEAAYQKTIRRARISLPHFIELCARDENGGRIKLDNIHRTWIFHVNYAWNRGKHAMIMAPFNSGKTSTLAIPLAAFLIGRNQQIRIKIVCAHDDNAKARVASVKSVIEATDYQTIFPAVRPGQKWDVHEAYVEREGHAVDPTLHARGVLAEGIGGRADIIIFDDVCTQKNSEELANRQKIKRFGRGTWLSRLDGDEARAMAFGTAWAQDDFTEDLKMDPNWCTLVQRVRLPDLEHYEQEVYGAASDYLPLMNAFIQNELHLRIDA